ncbi:MULTISPECIES: hypothetical protein [unclassified Aminobacter]|nr:MULTISPECIES: hypothetical protein [unclassified Aminobacter]TWH28082.1 hypothetical protein L611_004700000060 [Aminobacter sp. J15]
MKLTIELMPDEADALKRFAEQFAPLGLKDALLTLDQLFRI